MYLNFLDQTRLPYSHSFHTKLCLGHVSILEFHTCDLLFPFLLSSFLFSSSSSSSSSSLLSVFALSLSKTKMRYLFWSYPFLFHFPVKGGNFLPLSFKPLVSSTILHPYFILISFFYYSLVLQLSNICKSNFDIFTIASNLLYYF